MRGTNLVLAWKVDYVKSFYHGEGTNLVLTEIGIYLICIFVSAYHDVRNIS